LNDVGDMKSPVYSKMFLEYRRFVYEKQRLCWV
jgi:hypothetical protein